MAMQFEVDGLPPEPDTKPEGGGSSWSSSRAPSKRNKVHVGSKEFEHLQGFDMNEISGRVVVTAVKPSE